MGPLCPHGAGGEIGPHMHSSVVEAFLSDMGLGDYPETVPSLQKNGQECLSCVDTEDCS